MRDVQTRDLVQIYYECQIVIAISLQENGEFRNNKRKLCGKFGIWRMENVEEISKNRAVSIS